MASYQTITHDCIPIFIDSDSKNLILGSLPSIKSRNKAFIMLILRIDSLKY